MPKRAAPVFRRGQTWYSTRTRRTLGTKDRAEALRLARDERDAAPAREPEILPPETPPKSAGADAQTPPPSAPAAPPAARTFDPLEAVGGSGSPAGAPAAAVHDAAAAGAGSAAPSVAPDAVLSAVDRNAEADEAAARQLAEMFAGTLAIVAHAGVIAMGRKPGEPSQEAQDALVGAWMHKTRQWVKEDKFSAWSMIALATARLGFEMYSKGEPLAAPPAAAADEAPGA